MLNIGIIAICVTIGAAVGAFVYAIIGLAMEAVNKDNKDGD